MKAIVPFGRSIFAKRIFSLFILCALLPIGSLAAFSFWEMSATLREQTDQRLHRAAKNINVAIIQGLGFLQTEMEVMAKSSDNRPENSSGHFLGLTLFREGSAPHTIYGNPCPLPSLTDAMREHLARGLSVIFVERVPGALPRIYMASFSGWGDQDGRKLVGEISPGYLGEIIETAMPIEGEIVVLDSNGEPLYHSEVLSPDVVSRIAEELQRTHAGWFEWNREGDPILVSYRSIFLESIFHASSWTVVFLTPKAWMFAPLRSFTWMFLLIVVLTFLAVSLLSITQIRRRLAPLDKLTEGTRRISHGDFDSRVDIRSADEFETLAGSFNEMSEQLRVQFRTLEETNARLKEEMEERKQAEKQLLQSQKMEALGQLTGGIAHDFKNFLTIINGYSAILMQRTGRDDPSRKEIEAVHDAGEQAASLVGQLLEFSRKQVFDPKTIDLNKVLSGFDGLVRRLIGNHIDIDVVYGNDVGSVRIDPVQLQQVVMNLAVNARDAMPDGGKLTIVTANRDIDGASGSPYPVAEPGRYVTITVADTGCGMDENTRSRVFEPFFTTKAPGKGTGLGLSTVYGIVKRSQGHILLESEVGKGTSFTVFFPRMDPPTEKRDLSGAREAGRVEAGAETLLLAEDDDQVRDLVRSILTTWGYKVLEARDGEESLAIGSAHEGTIHLLLTDMMMPKMNGRELARRMEDARPGIKILYMSGYYEDGGNGGGGPHAAAGFIRKPFRPEALAQKVREVLDG